MSGSTTVAPDFAEHFAQSGIRRFRYVEAGRGKPVVILRSGPGPLPTPLARLLAGHFRILEFDLSNGPQPDAASRDFARALAEATAALALEQFGLVGSGANTSIALLLALEASGQLESLVLISPEDIFSPAKDATIQPDPELPGTIAEISSPTLLLLGTDDGTLPADTGARYAERIAGCYYVLVYGAGHDLEKQRLDVVFATVRDFLERRQAFVVNRASTLVNP